MRLILIVLISFSGTVLSRYYEKRRFDRSIYDYTDAPVQLRKEWTFTDYETNFRAYRDREENNCYIEKLVDDVAKQELIENEIQRKQTSKILYAPNEPLTKFEAWQIAGGRVVNFCTGRNIILLQYTIPTPARTIDPFFNILPYDENDIVTRRVADVVLTPLISRAKREAALEERQKFNENAKQNRLRRQVQQSAGKFRGQTQSQYLSIGNNDQKDGKAEAEATRETSRAVVSGSYGMGQAQSMSLGSSGCEDCPKYTDEGAPDRYIQRPRISGTSDTYAYPGTYSSFKQPGDATVHPGMITPGTAGYPNKVAPGTRTTDGVSHQGRIPPSVTGGHMVYPGNVPSTATRGTEINYPGSMPGSGAPYPASIPAVTTGSGAMYPVGATGPATGGNIPYPREVPGSATRGSIPSYPVDAPGSTIGGDLPYQGNVPGFTTGRNVPYPGRVPGSTSGGNIQSYPGGVPGPLGGGNVPSYPGGLPGSANGRNIPYPEGVLGPTTGNVAYPGRMSGGYAPYPDTTPGAMVETGATYIGGLPVSTADSGATYIRGVPGSRTGGDMVYPPGTTGATGVTYPGRVPVDSGPDYSRVVSGRTNGGNVPYPVILPGTATDGGTVYHGGVPGIDGGPVQPDNTQGTYYGGIRPGGQEIVPGRLETESKATADTKMYPDGQIPRSQYYGERHYPPNTGNTYQNGGPLGVPPGGITRGTTATDTRGIYPSGPLPPGGHVTQVGHYPGGISPDIAINRGAIPGAPGLISTGPTSNTRPAAVYPDGTRIHTGPDNMHVQNVDADQSGIPYPPGHVKYPEGSMVQSPDAGQYSNNRGVMYPGYSQQEGQYPSSVTWQDRGMPTSGLLREPASRGIDRPESERYPNEGQDARQQYRGFQYPPNVPPATNTGDVSQYYQQPGSLVLAEDDDSNSQASSSVKQTDSGTQASASAQGKYGQGTSQSQVTGTYSGSGSFSAQAGSTDVNKSVQTEINGGKEGASSNAQGVGGHGKSQAQVQLNPDLGATTTGAQSSGWNHGTNSQVQASSRGGMADAQANGEGSTSSQAQIGFQPYLKTDEKLEKRAKPFRGGGTASAQSGTHAGQSQSQLDGSFQYGITYTGAAQAGSGSGAIASRKPFNFSLTDTKLFKPFKPSYTPQLSNKNDSEATNSSSDNDYEEKSDKLQQGLQTSSSSVRKIISQPMNQATQNTDTKLNRSVDRSQVDDTVYDYEDDYDVEDYDNAPIQPSLNSKTSKTYITEQNNSHHQGQTIHVTTGKQYDAQVKQTTNAAQLDDMLQPGESLSGYTIPHGFRGRVTSVAGDKTIAQGDGKSQSQTVALVSKEPNMTHDNKSPISEIRSLKTNHERLMEDHVSMRAKQNRNFAPDQNQQMSTEYTRPMSNASIKPSYYTITNSVAGKMDDRNSPRKYEHRYYTKSSTCGYFTFSCNVVYGSNGRTKICKPKMPTYPDGTPMKC